MGLGQPNITIDFATTAAASIALSTKGTAALIIRDTEESGMHTLESVTDIPDGLSDDNKAYINRCFTGYQNVPSKVLLYVTGLEDDISGSLDKMALVDFDYLCLPPTATTAECTTTSDWIKSQRQNSYKKYKAVLPDTAADSEAIVNFSSTGMTEGTKTFTAAEFASRIAGIIIGTPMKMSSTYAPLSELTDIDRLSRSEQDDAIKNGKYILWHNGKEVLTGRAVNSLVTTTEDKGAAFQKIKIVEIIDMIKSDLRTTIEESYIGKYANNYDNKCTLVTAIDGYLSKLAAKEYIETDYTVEIDVDAQKNYLKSAGTDTSSMTDQEIKEANTGSQVFIAITLKILDAIEDVTISVSI
ncbi:MAG: phage tail sheath subtilisin-like domain-containing protein [Clostridia bacterium]|jgi:hypothetical protein|nr:phage tail sheath subtilisin-like domain-containing protein [Clostridia bacterium]